MKVSEISRENAGSKETWIKNGFRPRCGIDWNLRRQKKLADRQKQDQERFLILSLENRDATD